MHKRHRILAVDDSQVNLAILEDMLADSYALRLAGTGEEALTVAREFRPEIVLLDIMMPGMGGFEVCERLRKDPGLSHTKIILLSAKTEVANRLKGYEVGADDFISKPFNHEELLAKLTVFLRLKSVEELDALKSDVLHLISHETRTPLNGILGVLQLLAESDSPGTADEQELIQQALLSGHRLESLVQKALLYAELRSGRVTFRPEPLCLRALFEDVIKPLGPRATARGVSVELRRRDAGRRDRGPGPLAVRLREPRRQRDPIQRHDRSDRGRRWHVAATTPRCPWPTAVPESRRTTCLISSRGSFRRTSRTTAKGMA